MNVPQAALMHALKEAGWVDMGRILSQELSSRKHVYCAPELAGRSKSELRRLVEDNPAPAMVRVK